MKRRWTYSLFVFALIGAALRAETMVQRPGPDDAKPVATCSLQTLPEPDENSMRRPMVLYTLQPPPENPLENYERTPLGDWRMPATVDRNDPWLRLLLLDPKRPVVIDLAVFIDGRPFRESREAWIDELLRPGDGNNTAAAEGTKPAESASEAENADDKEKAAEAEEQSAPDTDAAKAGEEPESKTNDDPAATDSKDTEAQEKDKRGKDEETENADGKEKETDDAKPAQKPGVAAQSRKAPAMAERLKTYLAAGGGAVEREEIRWLIAEWGSGPPVLLLGPSLSWQRAGLAPLLAYLDREQDGGLSAAEITTAAAALRRADVDADDVLDTNEIRRAATRPAATPFDTEHSLLVELDSQTDWDGLAATIERIYAQNGPNSAMDAQQVRELLNKPADVTLRVDFGTGEGKTSGVSVVSVNSELGDAGKVVAATKDVVALDLGADYIEFSAAQTKSGDKADVAGTQVAIGAAIDGNPLLRLLDRDNDGRLTMRERQDLTGMLSALDRDGDGAVGSGEMPLPIRFAVTLGPHVHQLLATPAGSARTITPRETAPAAPAWFASMDKNHDGDLSRNEFLGNREQFKQIDGDNDGLVSVAEALKVNPGQ